jgi:hypothetical protein
MSSLTKLSEAVDDVNRICGYLATDDFAHNPIRTDDIVQEAGSTEFDVIAVFGNQVLATFTEACSLFRAGFAQQLLFSGGCGHSTELLRANIAKSARYGRFLLDGLIGDAWPEADMFAKMAQIEFGIPADKILIENASTNTGENARFSMALLSQLASAPHNILVMQDPVLQRRTMLTLSLAVERLPEQPLLFSRSAFVPLLKVDGKGQVQLSPPEANDAWDLNRFISLVLGEIERIRNDENGYGPKGRGFLPAIEIPADVLSSYENVARMVSSK